MSSESKEREKCVNVQVAVRCRPLSTREKSEGTASVVACRSASGEVAVAQMLGTKKRDRKFHYDKVRSRIRGGCLHVERRRLTRALARGRRCSASTLRRRTCTTAWRRPSWVTPP